MSYEYGIIEFGALKGNGAKVCADGELLTQAYWRKLFVDDLAGARAFARKVFPAAQHRAQRQKIAGYSLTVVGFLDGHVFLRLK